MSARKRRTPGVPTPPLGHRTLQERSFELLRDWILDGSLKPGRRLQLRDIASGLQLSTIPIREALVRLEGTGLVTQEPHRGYRVASLTVGDLHDYYNVRLILEVAAARQGAAVINDSAVAELREIVDALEAAVPEGDFSAILALDEDFLAIIYGAVENKLLADLIRGLWDRVQPYKLLFNSVEHGMAATFVLDDNRELLAACEARDGARAGDVLEASLQKAHMRLTGLLEMYEQTIAASRDDTSTEEPLEALCRRLAGSRIDE